MEIAHVDHSGLDILLNTKQNELNCQFLFANCAKNENYILRIDQLKTLLKILLNTSIY